MAGGPNECRKRALECVRIANSSLDPKSRDIFADMARTWIQVAIDLEGIQTPWGPGSRAPTRKEGSIPKQARDAISSLCKYVRNKCVRDGLVSAGPDLHRESGGSSAASAWRIRDTDHGEANLPDRG